VSGGPSGHESGAAALERLSDEFFEVVHSTDPLTATQLGVPGFDALLPDPSRAGAARGAQRLAAIEAQVSAIDAGRLGAADRTGHAVLAHLAAGARADLEHGLWEANASAGGYVSPAAVVFQSVPKAPLTSPQAVADYLTRLRGLRGYLDAVTGRYREAVGDGRVSARVGVQQAIDQLEGHLRRDVLQDVLVSVALPPSVDGDAVRAEAAVIVAAAGLPGAGPAARRAAGRAGRHPVRARRPRGLPGGRRAPYDHQPVPRGNPPDRAGHPGWAGR
jgi:uncharacterized protein (DUF885 family)